MLDKIAQSMGTKVVMWDTVNDAIDRNISFGMIVNTDKYLTEEDRNKLKQKSFIG